jgi:hypothetical protein
MGTKRKWKYKYEPYDLSGSKFNSWDEFTEANERKECANPACVKKRHHRSKFCPKCGRFCTMLGDPRLRPLNLKQYRKEIILAEEMIAFNKDNIVVSDFKEKLLTLAEQGQKGLPIEWATYWSGIYGVYNHPRINHRKSPYNTMAKLVGIYVFYERTHNEVIANDRFWHYSLGDILLAGCKSTVKPRATGKRMRKLGKFVWDAFSFYFIRLGRGVMRNEVHKRNRREQLANAQVLLPELKGEKEDHEE